MQKHSIRIACFTPIQIKRIGLEHGRRLIGCCLVSYFIPLWSSVSLPMLFTIFQVVGVELLPICWADNELSRQEIRSTADITLNMSLKSSQDFKLRILHSETSKKVRCIRWYPHQTVNYVKPFCTVSAGREFFKSEKPNEYIWILL